MLNTLMINQFTIRLHNDFWFIKKIVYLHRYLLEMIR